jgi:hypothetical protein
MKHTDVGFVSHCERLMKMLMEHREIALNEFVEGLSKSVPDFAALSERQDVVELFADLRAEMDDFDEAIIDVLLADSLADAESIVGEFLAGMEKA